MKQVCDVLSHVQLRLALQASCDTNIDVQDCVHDDEVVDQPQMPLFSQTFGSCTFVQDWTHVPVFETHWQLPSRAQLVTAPYSSPHLSVHVAPFHWQVASFAQLALFRLSSQAVLHVWLDGFHEQPVCDKHRAWLSLLAHATWQLLAIAFH